MADQSNNVDRNIRLMYALNFCIGMVFWYGIEKIFITKTLGLTPRDISLLVMVYAFVQVIFNIPSGALADKWSRKNTLTLALCMFMIANVILGLSTSLGMYLLGTFIWGAYLVCFTGTEEALIYDSLLQLDREKDYKRIYGRGQALFMFGIFISSASSGFIAAHLGIRAPYFLTLISIGLGLAVTTLLVEPTVHKQIVDQKLAKHMAEAVKLLSSTQVLRHIVLICLALFTVQTLFYEYAQLFYIAVFAGSTIYTGIANGVGGLGVAVGNLLTKQLRFTGYGFLAMGVLLFAAMKASPAWVHSITFLTFTIAFGASLANINDLKQRQIPSHIRATATSAINMLCYLIIVPLSYIFSLIAEKRSIFAAYKGLAALCILYYVFYMWRARAVLRQTFPDGDVVTRLEKL